MANLKFEQWVLLITKLAEDRISYQLHELYKLYDFKAAYDAGGEVNSIFEQILVRLKREL